ncbi:putative RNA recognition motif domain, nucleotide-binding alpha-beta plait domain superfamily [Helianthus anomalus]
MYYIYRGRNVLKFFVFNLPEGCTPWELRCCLEGFGKIVGTYVAKKRDKGGCRFGFVSFVEVKDGVGLEKSLMGFKMGDYRLKMNIARFASENSGFAGQSEKKKQGADVASSGTETFRPTLGIIDRTVTCWGILRGPVPVVTDFRNELLKDPIPWGLTILISFEDVESTTSFLEAKSLWGPWFSKLEVWNGQSLSSERMAWLKVQGAPLHILVPEVLSSIGEMFGKVLYVPKFLSDSQDLSFMRVGILAGEGPRFSEQVVLKWKEKSYRVWVEEELEEWVPDCLGIGDRCRSEGESPEQSSPVVRSADISIQENEEFLHGNDRKEWEEPCASVSKKGGDNGSCLHGKSKGPTFPFFDAGTWLEEGNSVNDKVYFFILKRGLDPRGGGRLLGRQSHLVAQVVFWTQWRRVGLANVLGSFWKKKAIHSLWIGF